MNQTDAIDQQDTEITRRRYQRLSRFYDLIETMAEKRYHPWRKRIWSYVNGGSLLEVGVGTGKNLPYYPASAYITSIDLTPGMLEQAKRKARILGFDSRVSLQLGDAQALEKVPQAVVYAALVGYGHRAQHCAH